MLASAVAGGCGPAPSPDRPAAAPPADTVTRATVVVADTSEEEEYPQVPRDSTDRCWMTDPARNARADSATIHNGVTFRCALRRGGPEVRLVVSGEWGIPMGVDVHSPPDAPRRSQQLLLDTDERASALAGIVTGDDLNDDGWTDLKVLTWSGSGGAFFDVFMYAPGRSAFVKDSTLSGEGAVAPLDEGPCVWTGSRMGIGHRRSAEWCWAGGRWVLERTRERIAITLPGTDPGIDVWLDSVRERRGDRMRLRVDTVQDTIR